MIVSAAIVSMTFQSNSVLINDKGNDLITVFPLKFDLELINRLQLWGNIKELYEVSLKYNQASKLRRSLRKKST